MPQGSSKYWYKSKKMPEHDQLKIKKMVRGERIGTIYLGEDQKQLLNVTGDVFAKIFMLNRQYLYRGEFTAPSRENNYDSSQNYLTEDGLGGFSISKSGWLTSLFSNYPISGFAKSVKEYIIHDAYKLVCIVAETDTENGLVTLYEHEYKFRRYANTTDDTEAMREDYGDRFINDFIKSNGTPHHIFMIGQNARGNEGDIKTFDDYYEAEAYVERTVVNGVN